MTARRWHVLTGAGLVAFFWWYGYDGGETLAYVFGGLLWSALLGAALGWLVYRLRGKRA